MNLLLHAVFLLVVATLQAIGQDFDALPNEAIVVLSEQSYGRLLQTFGRASVANDFRLQQILPGVKSLRWICENLPAEGSEARQKLSSINAEHWAVVEFDDIHVPSFKNSGSRSAKIEEQARFAAVKMVLEQSRAVEFIQPNHLVSAASGFEPNDPLYERQKSQMELIGAPLLWSMQRSQRKDANISKQNEFAIVVIDSGIDASHLDLVDNVDFVNGRSFVGKDPYTDEGEGFQPHGTNISGLFARGNNNIGGAGVSWNTKIVSFQVWYRERKPKDQENGPGGPFFLNGSEENLIRAFLAVLELPYKLVVVNASLLNADTPLFRKVLEVLQDKALIVTAAGNSSADTSDPLMISYQPCYASAVMPHVVCVGAMSPNGRLTGFSNRGKYVNLAAPGEGVLTTSPRNQYGVVMGTSIAAPVVSGTVASVVEDISLDSLSPAILKQALLAGAKFDPAILEDTPLWQIEKPRHVWVPGMKRALQRILAGQPAEIPASPRMSVFGVTEALTGRSELNAGDWISIWGENFTGTAEQAISFPSEVLGGIQVLLNGRPLPLSYVGPGQINALLPIEPAWLFLPPSKNTLIVVRVNADGEAETDSAVLLPKFVLRSTSPGATQ